MLRNCLLLCLTFLANKNKKEASNIWEDLWDSQSCFYQRKNPKKKPQKVVIFLSQVLFDKKTEFERDALDMPTRKILGAPENSKQELIFIVWVVIRNLYNISNNDWMVAEEKFDLKVLYLLALTSSNPSA